MLMTIIAGIWLQLVSATSGTIASEGIQEVNFSEIERYMNLQNDTVYVISFWATWCGPCRTEIPEIERVYRDMKGKKVNFLLVSLDFPEQKDKGLAEYIKNNAVTAPVILLNDPDANAWIEKVDPSWTGALPATLVYKGDSRYFFEKSVTYDDLNQHILLLTH